MIIQPTAKWINPIAIPTYGVFRRSRNQGTIDVIDPVGTWLIENGYAVDKKSSVTPKPAIPIPTPTPAPVPVPVSEPVKPKKTPTKPFVLEKDS